MNLHINAKTLSEVNETKILGLYLDKHFRYKTHIENLGKYLKRCIGMFYNFRNIFTKPVLHIMYHSLVISKVKYAAPFYFNSASTNIRMIHRYHDKICKLLSIPNCLNNYVNNEKIAIAKIIRNPSDTAPEIYKIVHSKFNINRTCNSRKQLFHYKFSKFPQKDIIQLTCELGTAWSIQVLNNWQIIYYSTVSMYPTLFYHFIHISNLLYSIFSNHSIFIWLSYFGNSYLN
jgi:hypothetical protein